jgi:hypothetical protein
MAHTATRRRCLAVMACCALLTTLMTSLAPAAGASSPTLTSVSLSANDVPGFHSVSADDETFKVPNDQGTDQAFISCAKGHPLIDQFDSGPDALVSQVYGQGENPYGTPVLSVASAAFGDGSVADAQAAEAALADPTFQNCWARASDALNKQQGLSVPTSPSTVEEQSDPDLTTSGVAFVIDSNYSVLGGPSIYAQLAVTVMQQGALTVMLITLAYNEAYPTADRVSTASRIAKRMGGTPPPPPRKLTECLATQLPQPTVPVLSNAQVTSDVQQKVTLLSVYQEPGLACIWVGSLAPKPTTNAPVFNKYTVELWLYLNVFTSQTSAKAAFTNAQTVFGPAKSVSGLGATVVLQGGQDEVTEALTAMDGDDVFSVDIGSGEFIKDTTAQNYLIAAAKQVIARLSIRKNHGVSAPTNLSVSDSNGEVTAAWKPPPIHNGSTIIGYTVTAEPTANDRRPQPKSSAISLPVSASTPSAHLPGLIEDCHQRYVVTVAADTAAGQGNAATSASFQPSGIVMPGKAPPYVVILLDGINEAQPGFTMNPYKPTASGTPSYCPETWDASTHTGNESDFVTSPKGPWSFFHKWNFGEVNSNGSGIRSGDQYTSVESEPRTLPGDPKPGIETHSFMLDALAAHGAIILPFSYEGAGLTKKSKGVPTFIFNGYSTCDSGSPPNPTCNGNIGQDEKYLNEEVATVASTWPSSKIVIIGHSQGGMIAWKWWQDYPHPRNLAFGFSLDSPINGGCVGGNSHQATCLGPIGYPGWGTRVYSDHSELNFDAEHGNRFRFIGTYGDSLELIGPIALYGSTGAENLEHTLLFPYGGLNPLGLQVSTVENVCADPLNESHCPAPAPPDHISNCPIGKKPPPWEVAHFVVKYCPGDVAYINNTIGLSNT